jgi:hypothetical protein
MKIVDSIGKQYTLLKDIFKSNGSNISTEIDQY